MVAQEVPQDNEVVTYTYLSWNWRALAVDAVIVVVLWNFDEDLYCSQMGTVVSSWKIRQFGNSFPLVNPSSFTCYSVRMGFYDI